MKQREAFESFGPRGAGQSFPVPRGANGNDKVPEEKVPRVLECDGTKGQLAVGSPGPRRSLALAIDAERDVRVGGLEAWEAGLQPELRSVGHGRDVNLVPALQVERFGRRLKFQEGCAQVRESGRQGRRRGQARAPASEQVDS